MTQESLKALIEVRESLEAFAAVADQEGWKQPEAIRMLSVADFRKAREAADLLTYEISMQRAIAVGQTPLGG